MKAKIVLSNSGGELSSVVIDVNDETDPNISEAVADIATNGIQIGDTITVTETQQEVIREASAQDRTRMGGDQCILDDYIES